MWRIHQALGLAAISVLLAACGLSRQALPSTPLDVADAYASPSNATLTSPEEGWWQTFGDASLSQAVEATLAGNLTLATAQARIAQATSAVRQTRSGWFPSIDATLSAGRARSFAPPPLDAATAGQLQASVAAAYEVDIWGRTRQGVRAASAEVSALEADTEAIAMSLSASVAEIWLTVVHLRARGALLDEQLATQRRFIELVERRFVIGTASALDIEQQRGQRDALVTEQIQLQGQLASASVSLSALQGGPISIQTPETPTALPALPLAPSLGVPLDLLTRRPDVRAAQARAAAADSRVTAAVADRLPSLRLAASVSSQGTSVRNLFDQLFWNIAASVTAPLVDGGRRRAAVAQAESVLDVALLTWADTLLTAISEVEHAAAQTDAQQAYIDALEQQMQSAERALSLSEEQYRFGSGDYLRVLSAVATLQSLERVQFVAARQ
jgi:multidrug efflux system outer membrane protein